MAEPAQPPFALRAPLREGGLAARKVFRDWAVGIVDAILPAVEAADPEWPARPEDQHGARQVYRKRLLTLAELSFAFSPELAPGETDTWATIGIAIKVHLGKVVFPPSSSARAPRGNPPAIDSCQWFELKTWFHPQIAPPRNAVPYGGDWFGGWRTPDGQLWVLLADVAGHGLAGQLIASGLPDLWAHYWEVASAPPTTPLDVFAWLDEQLAAVLHDMAFVEAAVARFTPDGSVALAGGHRAILRRSASPLGTWEVTRWDVGGGLLGVGVFAAGARNGRTSDTRLARSDELLLGTDGLYDVFGEARVDVLVAQASTRPLQEVAGELVPAALAAPEKPDDLTVIIVRYRGK
jgi:hypothetical protein